MPGEVHRTDGLASYRSLPEWQRQWWECEEKIGECCLIPDTMGWQWTEKNFKRYKKLLLFEEKLILHGPPDRDFNPVWITGEEHDQENFLLVLRYYTKRLTKTLKNRDINISEEFAGIVAHIIQETCFPSHSIPNPHFYKYFYQPEDAVPSYHEIIDFISLKPVVSKPSLIGTTPEEISYRLWIQLEKQISYSKKNCAQLLEIINSRKTKELAKFLQASADSACKIVSDTWYSCISVASNQICKKESDKLQKFSLCEIIPYFIHPGGMYKTIPGNYLIKDEKKQPLYVLIGNTKKRVKNE